MLADRSYSYAIVILLTIIVLVQSEQLQRPTLVVVTVATDETDGLIRLRRSAEAFGIELNVFGLGEQWNGGDTRIEQGGGQKVRILKRSLEIYKDRNDVILLFTDAYDVVFNGGEEQILEKFIDFYGDYRVVFAAEPFCWPQKELAPNYPLVRFGKRFLNSGLFMGYATEIWQIINAYPIADKDDDQLYYTNVYLDEKLPVSFSKIIHY
uniref:Procollagen-lysine 5-dioxygenase n=1 Tax=Ascaris lumbricoides TaxID=6252 RepID=A0A0M3IB57_ASCLU